MEIKASNLLSKFGINASLPFLVVRTKGVVSMSDNDFRLAINDRKGRIHIDEERLRMPGAMLEIKQRTGISQPTTEGVR